MKAFDFHVTDFNEQKYPEDCKKIIAYLKDVGTINCSETTIATFYHKFSEECYAAGWLTLTDDLLADFATWLSEQEI